MRIEFTFKPQIQTKRKNCRKISNALFRLNSKWQKHRRVSRPALGITMRVGRFGVN